MKRELWVKFILAANDAVPLTSVESYLYVRDEICPPFFFIRKIKYMRAHFNCSACVQLQIFLVSKLYLWSRNNRKDLSSHTVVAGRWHCLPALHFLCFFLWATGVIYSVFHSVRLGTFLWQSQGDWHVESEPTQSGGFICTWFWD